VSLIFESLAEYRSTRGKAQVVRRVLPVLEGSNPEPINYPTPC